MLARDRRPCMHFWLYSLLIPPAHQNRCSLPTATFDRLEQKAIELNRQLSVVTAVEAIFVTIFQLPPPPHHSTTSYVPTCAEETARSPKETGGTDWHAPAAGSGSPRRRRPRSWFQRNRSRLPLRRRHQRQLQACSRAMGELRWKDKADGQTKEDRCPLCSSDRQFEPGLRIMVSPCYHKM